MRMRVQLLMAAMIPCALGLTACAATGPAIARLPTELTNCAAEPEAPALPAIEWTTVDTARPIVRTRDSSMLSYVLALRAWGADCAAKVAGAAAWNRALGK